MTGTRPRMALLATGNILQRQHLTASMLAFDVDASHQGPPSLMTLKSAEHQMVLAALRHENGNVSQAARTLGIARATLYRRLSAYGSDARGQGR